MGFTYLGYVLLPICILFFFKTDLLYFLTIFFVPFTATSVFNITHASHGVGIQPVVLTGSFWMLSFLLRTITNNKPKPISKPLMTYYLFMISFASICIISTIRHIAWYPYITHMINDNDVIYSPFTQVIYLIFGLALALFIAIYNSSLETIKKTLKIMVISGMFVSTWGIMQFALYYLNTPYPYMIFNNSASHYASAYQAVFSTLGLKRVSSVATEPSILGLFLTLPFTTLLISRLYKKYFISDRADKLALALCLTTLVLTTSSATIVALVFILLSCSLYTIYLGIGRKRSLLWLIGIVTAAITTYLLIPIVNSFVNAYIFNKLSTYSGVTRLDTVFNAAKIFLLHPLLGLGWGSVTCNDLIFSLLANTGLPGLLSLSMLLIYIISTLVKHNNILHKQFYDLGHISTTILMLVTTIIFYNEITGFSYVFSMFWLIIGISIATLAVISRHFSAEQRNVICE